MKKFLLFALLLIPVPVFATYMQPSLGCVNTANHNQCSSVTYEIINGNDWYTVESNFNEMVNKVTFIYDMSSFQNDYVNFIFYTSARMNNIVVTLDNDLCDIKTGLLTDPGTSSSLNASNYGFTCKVSKKSEVYLNIFISRIYTMNTKFAISANNKLFNDLNSANIQSSIDTQTAQQNAQNQIINNTNTGTNASDFSNVVNNNTLPNNSHAFDILGGLQGLINGLQPSGSCSRISVPIPFTNQSVVLPCMTTDVYSVHFPEIVVIWQLLVRGIGYYYILVNILRLVKETIDPFNFKLEVMDL